MQTFKKTNLFIFEFIYIKLRFATINLNHRNIVRGKERETHRV